MTAINQKQLPPYQSATIHDKVKSENHLPGKQDVSLFFDRRLMGKMEPPLRSQSFPESLNWTQSTSPNSNRNMMYGGRRWGFSNKYDGAESNIERPAMIQEDMSDLTDFKSKPSARPSAMGMDTTATIAAMRGQGLPSLLDITPSATEPSEVTDLGQRMYNELKLQGRVRSFPVEEEDSIGSLADRIFESTCENSQDRADFLPERQLDRLIHRKSVILEMKRWIPTLSNDQADAFSKKICADECFEQTDSTIKDTKVKSYRKVFAILVLINEVASIEKFLDEELCDTDLPLKRHFEQHGVRRKFDLRRKDALEHPLPCFEAWTQITLRNFEQYQWAMIAPFLTKGQRKDVKHYVFDSSIVLPFTFIKDTGDDEQEKARRGGFSMVYQADIHPDHHDFNGSDCNSLTASEARRNTFAIKRLDSQSKSAFQKEVKVLKKFSGDAHPHLISLLATYERSNVFYLVFPWAEADLMTYWKSENPNPIFDIETVVWMAEQCRGIAEGLTKLHKYETGLQEHGEAPMLTSNTFENESLVHGKPGPLYGRHGDIKPENILWFPSGNELGHKGVLKISDFGLSELHTHYSKTKESRVANSPTYRPPECDMSKKIIKQSYDIWTLGCVYLEFIAWILGGWTLVAKFASQRRFTDIGGSKSDTFFEILHRGMAAARGEARVKPSVTAFIRELHMHPRCSEFLHQFLLTIETEMLIVESADNRRLECKQLTKTLKGWHEACTESEIFALKPAPWSR